MHTTQATAEGLAPHSHELMELMGGWATDAHSAVQWALSCDAVRVQAGGGTGVALPRPDHRGHMSAVTLACERGDEASLRRLLAGGSRPDLPVPAFNSWAPPLYYAAQSGAAACAALLLEAAASVDGGRADDGSTPLYTAAYSGHTEVARLLLAAGADASRALVATPSDPGSCGATAAHAAALMGHADVLRLLPPHPAAVYNPLRLGTALRQAAAGGHAECVRLLLAGADGEGGIGRRRLARAPRRGESDVSFALDDALLQQADKTPEATRAIVAELLRAGADPDVAFRTHEGHQVAPLELVVSDGPADAALVEMLLAHGADPDRAPLALAAQRESTAVCQLLIAYGAAGRPPPLDQAHLPADDPLLCSWALGNAAAMQRLMRRGIRFRRPPTGGVGPCRSLAQAATMPWAPSRHHLHSPCTRGAAGWLLLVAMALRSRPGGRLPALPEHIWHTIIAAVHPGSCGRPECPNRVGSTDGCRYAFAAFDSIR